MFLVLPWQFDLIFCLLTNQNKTLLSSRKRCSKWSPGPENTFSFSWTEQNATWVRSRKRCFRGSHVTLKLIFGFCTIPKCDLGEVGKAMPGTRNSFSVSWPPQNAAYVSSRKRNFKWLQGTTNSFSASWPAPNRIWVNWRKRWFKWSNGTLKSFSVSLQAEITTFFKSIKRRFTWWNGTLKSFFASW